MSRCQHGTSPVICGYCIRDSERAEGYARGIADACAFLRQPDLMGARYGEAFAAAIEERFVLAARDKST